MTTTTLGFFRLWTFAFCVLPFALSAARAEDFLPKAQPASRYDQMADRSPFTAPSVPVPVAATTPPPPGPHWWDGMFVALVMQKGNVYFATVVDRPSGKRYLLESGKVDPDSHLLLAEVQLADRSEDTTVTVRKDAEVAPPLRFDNGGGNSAPATAPGIPGAAPPRPLPGGLPTFNANNQPAGLRPPPAPPVQPPNGNIVRRLGPIPARPQTIPSNPALNRPAPNQPANGPARRPVIPANDDDDDDD